MGRPRLRRDGEPQGRLVVAVLGWLGVGVGVVGLATHQFAVGWQPWITAVSSVAPPGSDHRGLIARVSLPH